VAAVIYAGASIAAIGIALRGYRRHRVTPLWVLPTGVFTALAGILGALVLLPTVRMEVGRGAAVTIVVLVIISLDICRMPRRQVDRRRFEQERAELLAALLS